LLTDLTLVILISFLPGLCGHNFLWGGACPPGAIVDAGKHAS